MAFYDKFPYTNYQELNLDWLLQEVSKVRDIRDGSEASAAAALASEKAAKASENAAAASQKAAANSEKAAANSKNAAAGSEAASAEYLAQIGTHAAGAVADWLRENIRPTTPAVDASLSVSGAAADAKKTGDVKNAFDVGNAYGANASAIEITERTSSGLTIAKQADGAYRVRGTSTAIFNGTLGSFEQKAGQRYHFRLDMSEENTKTKQYYIYLLGVAGAEWMVASEYDWVAADTKTIKIQLYCKEGAAPNFTIKPVLALNSPNAYLQKQIDEFNSATTLTDFDLITEIGNIDAPPHTWTNSTSRVRIMQDHPVILPAGAKIYLSDYSAARLYVIWKADDGTWGYKGWISSDSSETVYITTTAGKYWVLLTAVPETTVTDKRALSSLIRMQTPASIYDHLTAQAPMTQNYNHIVRSINHRGYSRIAPENTIPAFQLSKKVGFWAVETDVRFTSDGVPVLLHDATINRTARNADGTEISGTINIADITYAQALKYDFGVYKGSEFTGTKIPTLGEFVAFCKKASMEMYIEIKDETGTRVADIVNLVKSYGMLRHVSWVAFSYTAIEKVLVVDSKARIGLISGDISTATADRLNALQTADNTVFCDAAENVINSETAPIITSAGFELETYTPNSIDKIVQLSQWVTGVTSDYIVAGQVLLESAL